jgi:hypothetical protein
MDIHAPESPVNSFKDFAIHIAIVTLGILIALGLEGLRETVYEHRLVRETRENFRVEMEQSKESMNAEIKRVDTGRDLLKTLAAEAPTLAQQHPEQVADRLDAISNPNYFFATNSWQAALSTGVLAHMSAQEVSTYAWAAEGTRIYNALQTETRQSETAAIVYWRSHPHPTPEQIAEGQERILRFENAEQTLSQAGPQTLKSFQHSLYAASR